MRSIFLSSNIRGAGDAIAIAAKPVARLIDAATSVLPKKYRTDVQHCRGCHGKGGRQDRLNKAFPF
jgi:hypothetical protein